MGKGAYDNTYIPVFLRKWHISTVFDQIHLDFQEKSEILEQLAAVGEKADGGFRGSS